MTSRIYTTGEATVSSQTVFIVEFNVTCKNGVQVCIVAKELRHNKKYLIL